MFELYCEKQCVRFVAQKCSLSPTTVRKYRKRDNWDARVAGIKAKAQEKLDGKISTELAKRIETYKNILNAGLNHKIKRLKEQIEAGEEPTLDLSIKDCDRLERLLKFLDGQPDSRPDTGDGKLPDELKPLLDKLRSDPTLCEKLGDKVAELVSIGDG